MVGIILGIGMFSLGIAMLVVSTTTSALVKNKNSNSGNQSFFTAESAVREGVYQTLKSSLAYTGGTQAMLNNSISDSDIQIVDLGWPKVQVLGSSHSRLTEREISYVLNIFPAGAVFDHAIYAQNTLKLSGNANITGGSIFANGDIYLQNTLALVEDIYSGSSIDDNSGQNTVAMYENVTKLNPPEVNLLYYFNNADKIIGNVSDFNDYFDSEESTTIEDKIVYIYNISEIEITDVDFSGTLIVVGDLSISHSIFSQSDLLDDPLVIYVTGALSLGANAEITGIIYTDGLLVGNNGNPKVTGSIVVTGDTSNVELTSTIDINYVQNSWENITLDANTSGTPTVTDWSE